MRAVVLSVYIKAFLMPRTSCIVVFSKLLRFKELILQYACIGVLKLRQCLLQLI